MQALTRCLARYIVTLLTERCSAMQDEVFLNGTIVLPHKEIKETVLDAGTIIM